MFFPHARAYALVMSTYLNMNLLLHCIAWNKCCIMFFYGLKHNTRGQDLNWFFKKGIWCTSINGNHFYSLKNDIDFVNDNDIENDFGSLSETSFSRHWTGVGV